MFCTKPGYEKYFQDMLVDWDKIEKQSMDSKYWTIKLQKLEDVCQRKRRVSVLIGMAQR